MSGSALMDALLDPGVNVLGGLAQGFAQAALPTRMPTPIGAVLGMGAGGAMQGVGNAQRLQRGQQELTAGGMANQLTASGLPLALAQNEAMTRAWKDPNLMQTIYGPGSGSPFGVPAAPAPDGATPQRVPSPAGPVSSGVTPPVAGNDAGNGGGVGAATAAALASLPDDKTRSLVMNAAFSKGLPPEAIAPWIATLHNESGGNVNVADNKNTNGTVDAGIGQINSSNWGKFGLTDANVRDPATNLAASASIFGQNWKATGGHVGQSAAAYHTGSADNPDQKYVTDATTRLAQWKYPGAQFGQGASAPVVTADNAGAIADQYLAQAADLEKRQSMAKMFKLPMPAGDPAALRTAASQYRELALAGPKAGAAAAAEVGPKLELAEKSPVTLRAGGMQFYPRTGQVLKNPELREITDANGNTTYIHINPASPLAPPGTPGEAAPVLNPGGQPAIAKLPPDVVQGREELVRGLFGKDTDSYVAANNTQGWLNQLNHASRVMNEAGPAYMTGPFAETRLGLMSHINDAGRTLGLAAPFDEKAISSFEEMRKATTTAGFELASHYEGHARQAAATIVNATSAVPGMANSPQGFTLVSNGVNEGAQIAKDLHEYNLARFHGQDPYGIASPSAKGSTHGAGLETAEADFIKKFPAEMYSNRAISTVTPFKIAATDQAAAMKEMAKYLPGTVVVLANGRQTMVPPRPGAPSIPNYMHEYIQPTAPGGANAAP